MATYTAVFFVVAFVATSSAAPSDSNNKLSLKIPDECKGKGFCSIKPEGYDEMEEIINSLLPPNLIAQNLGDRIGDMEELSPESDWHNCPYRTKTESHYSHSADGLKHDIFIQTKLFSQPITTVTCANDKIQVGSEECFQHIGLSFLNMKSSCYTSTTKRTLYVVDPDTLKIKPQEYDIPCCCTCKITNSI